jgi:CRP/FNR family transcriptional regulator
MAGGYDIDKIVGAHPISLPAGAVVFRPNDDCPGFVVVKRGQIKVSLTSERGREIVLYRVRPGDVCLQTFSCLSRKTPYAAEGRVEEALTGVVLPPALFDRLMAEVPAFRAEVFGAVARRFSEFQYMVETLAFTGLEARLAAALLKLAGGRNQIEATHEAIAIEIGTAREVISRQLHQLAERGLVETSRGRVKILEIEALARLAQPAV